jgi:hypothetical protein
MLQIGFLLAGKVRKAYKDQSLLCEKQVTAEVVVMSQGSFLILGKVFFSSVLTEAVSDCDLIVNRCN